MARTLSDPAVKTCKTCGITKPTDQFHRRNNRTGGRVASCIECTKAAYAARPTVEPAMTGSKTCTDCVTVRPVTDFPRHRKTTDGRHQICKSCHGKRERERRARWKTEDLDRSRRNGRASELMRRYRMTVTTYDEMLAVQGGGCAICGKTPGEEGQMLAVDHDSSCCPGKKPKTCGACVRGLLCRECNNGIGHLGHDITRLAAAIEYLSR